jgi:Domain of unknown function (DUF4438), C-terminal/Domain of unknown function (DUF4438), N-terminal
MRPADNRARLVRARVAGRVAPARFHPELASHDRAGRIWRLPGTGGISLGVHSGDPVARWQADHLMVGASIEDADEPAGPGPLHRLSCLGNPVRDGAGRPLGIVAGKRGGLAPPHFAPQLVAVELPDAVAASLDPDAKVVVDTLGSGLALPDWPEIGLSNLAPELLDRLPIAAEDGRLRIDVRAVLPSRVAGPGLGSDAWIGDLEFTANETLAGSLAGLRFGDLVAFDQIDARAGRHHRPGHVAIGVVAHGPSPAPGHGPGLTLLLSGPAACLALRVTPDCGIGDALRHEAEAFVGDASRPRPRR